MPECSPPAFCEATIPVLQWLIILRIVTGLQFVFARMVSGEFHVRVLFRRWVLTSSLTRLEKGLTFFEPVCWYLYNTKVHRKGKKAVSSGFLFVQFGSFSPQVRKKSKEKGGEKSRRTDRARRSRETVSQAQADGSGKSSDQAFSSGTWGSLRSACSSSSSVGK